MAMDLVKYRFFSIEKTVQTFYYLQKFSKTDSKLELIKLLFFADRIHIRKHYSFISLDTYFAMKNGPVASNSLNVLDKNEEWLDNFSKEEFEYLNNVKIEGGNKIKRIIQQVPFDLLSNNEKQSLDRSIELFSGKNLVDISHDYPEWKRYKELFDKQLISSKPVQMQDFFCNPNIKDSPAIQKYFDGVDPLYENEDYLEEAKLFYFESLGYNAI